MAVSGMDWMIDAVLKAAGFDPVEAKQIIGQFVEKYVEQDQRLLKIEAMLVAQGKQIAAISAALNVEGKPNGENTGSIFAGGNTERTIKLATNG